MNKFYLVTIEGRRWVTLDMQFISTGIYIVPINDYNFSKLTVDGVDGSVSTTPITIASSLYTYYISLEEGNLYIRANASDISGFKNFVMTHILTATNDKDMYWNIDPDSPNTRLVNFEGRLSSKPSFSQSQENNLVGLLSVSTSNISLNNKDWFYKKYMTSFDSFKDSKVKIWECDRLPSSRTKFFIGFVQRFTCEENAVFYISDIFKRLNNTLYSNGDLNNSMAKSLSGNQPFISSNPIYKVFGRNSSFSLVEFVFGGLSYGYNLVPESMPEATCVSFNGTLSTSVNRVWATCIIEDVTTNEETFTVAGVTPLPIGPVVNFGIDITTGANNFTIGDTVKFSGGGFGTVALLSGNDNTVIIGGYTGGAIANGSTISIHKISALVIVKGSVEYRLLYGRDYTVNTITAGSVIGITLVNNFEANVSFGTPLNPSSDRMFFKARNPAGRASYSHGAQIKKLLLTEYSSDEINEDSFDDADTDLDLNLCYQAPFIGESFTSKRDILERLLRSSLGYLYVGEDFKINYGNFSPSIETDESDELTDIEISENTTSHITDFEDLYIGVNFNCSQFGVNARLSDEVSLYLHGGNLFFDLPVLTESFSNALVDLITVHFKKIMGFYTNPRITTSFGLNDLRSRIGQKKNIVSSKALDYFNATVISTNDMVLTQEISLVNLSEAKGNATASVNGSAEEVI